jgi:hypothetical protein
VSINIAANQKCSLYSQFVLPFVRHISREPRRGEGPVQRRRVGGTRRRYPDDAPVRISRDVQTGVMRRRRRPHPVGRRHLDPQRRRQLMAQPQR